MQTALSAATNAMLDAAWADQDAANAALDTALAEGRAGPVSGPLRFHVQSNETAPSSAAAPAQQPAGVASGITFEDIYTQFGLESRLTNLQKDESWKRYEGQCIEWSGELAYLDEGLFGGISIGFKHRSSTLTYDVLVSAPRGQRSSLLQWTEGETYTYRARLRSYPGAFLPISADWSCE